MRAPRGYLKKYNLSAPFRLRGFGFEFELEGFSTLVRENKAEQRLLKLTVVVFDPRWALGAVRQDCSACKSVADACALDLKIQAWGKKRRRRNKI